MADDRTQLMGARALASGYEIMWFEIIDVLGQGGFGITYLAKDKNLNRNVAIKEYLPTSFAYRHQDFSVKPITSDHGDNFAWGLDSFLKEAQTLARFSHKNIVRVQSVFEHNSTAYMVMDYEEGKNLSSIYKGSEQLDQAFFEDVFFPIFDGLQEIHELGFIHRDIKPANIYIRENNTPVLIDFGSARQTSQQQTGEMTSLVSQGYTPLEQYSSNYGEQGPWTDIYALAATLYQGVSGSKPAESLSRSACLLRAKPDVVLPLNTNEYPGYSQVFLDAIYTGLAIQPEERPADLYAWGECFDEDKVAVAGDFPGDQNAAQLSDIDDKTRIMSPPEQPPEHAQNTTGFPGQAPASQQQSSEPVDMGFANDTQMPATAETGADGTAAHKITAKPKAKRSKLLPIAASVVLLAGAGIGAYAFLSGKLGGNSLNIAELPKPVNPVQTILPSQHVVTRLDELDRLALYYAQAYALDQNNAQVNLGIQEVFREVGELAEDWNNTRFAEIGESIRRVAKRLPDTSNYHSRIDGLLADTSNRATSSSVLTLIESNQIVRPEGNSVLDIITSIDKSEYDLLTQEPAWEEMMGRLATSAASHLTNADFDSGARIVEAALAIHPEDATMLQLRDHLALRNTPQ